MNISERLQAEDSLRHRLLARLKDKRADLNALLEKMEWHWGIEDGVYRFYHQSLKVYGVQGMPQEAAELLQSLLPERPLNAWFRQIVKEGTARKFDLSHNDNWPQHTRPILEALFHAHYFVKMACKYAREPWSNLMQNGQAALLCLFDLR